MLCEFMLTISSTVFSFIAELGNTQLLALMLEVNLTRQIEI